MGCVSAGQTGDMEEIDREVLANFLQNRQNLQTIWKQFNKNEDDVLDRSDFDHLLFCALQIFCKERDPNMPPPSRSTLEPFIEKLRNELAPRIDRDGDGVISFEEFRSFGEYLKQEYRKLHNQNSTSTVETNITKNTTIGPIPDGFGTISGKTNTNRNDNIPPAAFENANIAQ